MIDITEIVKEIYSGSVHEIESAVLIGDDVICVNINGTNRIYKFEDNFTRLTQYDLCDGNLTTNHVDKFNKIIKIAKVNNKIEDILHD
jgi:hypothetical protein